MCLSIGGVWQSILGPTYSILCGKLGVLPSRASLSVLFVERGAVPLVWACKGTMCNLYMKQRQGRTKVSSQ